MTRRGLVRTVMCDLFGHRRIVLAGLAVSGLASAACGLAPNIGVLVAGVLGAVLWLAGVAAALTTVR